MRLASKDKGILPVMNPLFNLREICKQSALLEDHLNNPRKRCPDCIRKHFLTIEAFYEEAVSLDKESKFEKYLDGKAEMIREMQSEWLDSKDTKKYDSVCTSISQRLRGIRKDFAPECFDLRKMASLNNLKAPNLCSHRKLLDYNDYMELVGWRTATLSQTEKEERETERLVKNKPKKKPPRKDLMRKRIKVEDPDLENLGAGAGGDRDLSMNHKRVASAERVALAFLKEATSAKRKFRRNKSKQEAKDNEKSERRERYKKVREQLESDDKPYITSDAGNKITFSTAIKADPKTRERKEAEKILRKQKAKSNAEANKKKREQGKEVGDSKPSSEGAGSAEKSVEEPKRTDFFSLAVEELSNNDRAIYESDSGEEVNFSVAISSDPNTKQYQQAQRAIANLADAKKDSKAKDEAFQRKLEVAKKKKQRAGLQQEILDNPANFVALTQNGSSTTSSDEFMRAVAEMTLTEGFEDSVGLPKAEQLSQQEKSERAMAIKKLEDDLGNTDDPEVQESLGGQLQDLKDKHEQEDNERNERNVEARKEKVEDLLGSLRPEDFKVDFADNASKEEKKEAIRSVIDGSSQEGRDRVEENDGLKLVKNVLDIQPDVVEEVSKVDSDLVQIKRNDFISKLKDSFKITTFDDRNLNSSVLKKVEDVVNLLEKIPDVHIDKVQEGFATASQELADVFMNQGNLADSATALKDVIKDKYETSLSSASGNELGRIIASLAMEGAILDNFEYGLPNSDSLAVNVVNSRGQSQSAIKEEQVEALLYSQTLRFKGGEDSDYDRRNRALDHYEMKMKEATTDVDKAKYKASYKAVLTSKILEGDDNIPAGTPKIDSFFLEHARQSNHPDAIAIVAELASGDPLARPRVRSMKIKYLNGLDHDNFVQAVGGENGDFSGLLEVIDPEYCPDIPLNGESAGKKVPIKECPLPVAPEIRKAVRETISNMVADLYTVDPSGSMRGFSSKGFGAEDEDTKEWDMLLKNDKEELLRVMGMQNGPRKEAALAWLVLKLRNDNIQRLNLGEQIEGYDESRRQGEELFKYRRDQLEKIFFKASPDQSPEELKQILEELEKAFEENASTPTNFGTRGASLRKERILRSARRITSAKKVANQFISNNVFILGRYSSDPEGDTPMRRRATSYVDYQQRARQFEIGMRVYPYFGGKPDKSGVVVQIFPAIGMVDVQFPHGVSRFPVEDLVLDTSGDYENLAKTPDSIPGGRGVVPVSSGPAKSLITDSSKKRVASLYMNKLMRR